jgi:hypothetical protein
MNGNKKYFSTTKGQVFIQRGHQNPHWKHILFPKNSFATWGGEIEQRTNSEKTLPAMITTLPEAYPLME